jgi:hypothetical protein
MNDTLALHSDLVPLGRMDDIEGVPTVFCVARRVIQRRGLSLRVCNILRCKGISNEPKNTAECF